VVRPRAYGDGRGVLEAILYATFDNHGPNHRPAGS
jgi:hypothetical protein